MGEQLLPGIPDEVTWNEIVPKLSGTAFHISAISRAWLDAAQSYEVYNSRVQSHSTKIHVIVTYDRPGQVRPVMALYCMRDNSCVELPSIPDSAGRIFEGYRFVSLDGKIYVLGGWPDSVGSDEVYVLDLRACQRQWKRCASMTKPRKRFRCGVIKGCGKIYVYEGFDTKPEVYDSKENIWSRILPVTHSHYCHLYDRALMQKNKEAGGRETEHILDEEILAMVLYDFIRAVHSGRHFVASGKNYSMTLDGIFAIDAEGCPMTQLHSFSLPEIKPDTRLRFCNSKKRKRYKKKDTRLSELPARGVRAVQYVDDELLAMVSYLQDLEDETDGRHYYYLLRSKGFAGESKEIVWQIVQVPLSTGILFPRQNLLEYTIEL